uniref:Uncharacterized protein n=1 Tax=Auxenochlorella protothecoides TaxID=3075 RepID=A0A1D1ZQK6_AUXPR
MTVQAGLAVQCVAPGRAYGHPASPSPQRWRDQHGGSCRAQAPTRPPSTTISTVLHTEELSMRARAAVQGNDSAQTTTMGCRAGIAAQGSGWPGACADLLRPSPGLLAGLVVNSLVYLLGIRILRKGLTWVGYSSSWVLGTLSYAAFGYKGYLIVCLYFILGTLVTKVRMKQKEAEGIAEKRSGHRSLGSVCGSGFAGIVCAIGHLLAPQALPWQVRAWALQGMTELPLPAEIRPKTRDRSSAAGGLCGLILQQGSRHSVQRDWQSVRQPGIPCQHLSPGPTRHRGGCELGGLPRGAGSRDWDC